MPVAHFHVRTPSADQTLRLLTEGTRLYAEALEAPPDRVRLFVTPYTPESVASGGTVGAPTAYFTALVLARRPASTRDRLAAEFTTLLAQTLDLDASHVRGRVVQVEPQDWYIAGQPASVVRADEVATLRASRVAEPHQARPT